MTTDDGLGSGEDEDEGEDEDAKDVSRKPHLTWWREAWEDIKWISGGSSSGRDGTCLFISLQILASFRLYLGADHHPSKYCIAVATN